MKNTEKGQSGMGFLSWLILALIVLGLFGIGPCSNCMVSCGCNPKTHMGQKV